MKKLNGMRWKWWAGVTLALMLGLSSGLSAVAQASKQGEKAAKTLKSLAKEVQDGEAQMVTVTTTLNQLINKPGVDLSKRFKAFDKAVDRLQKIAADSRRLREGLQRNRDAYLKLWDQELAQISNEDVRARSADRRAQVEETLNRLSTLSQTVGESYRSYEATVLDIRKALGADLTPGGVQAIAPLANQARQSAIGVRDDLAKLRSELQSVGLKMSSKAPPKK